MKEEYGRTLNNSNRGWIKRTIVFLKGADELKARRDAQEVPENREPSSFQKTKYKGNLGDVSVARRTFYYRGFSTAHSE